METIVIVGGGAGGLELATRLGNQLGRAKRAKIVLIDRAPTHFWKPLLHEVASGTIDPGMHQIEYAAQAADHHFQFVRGEMICLDRFKHTIEVNAYSPQDGFEAVFKRHIHYDKLVLALGAVTNFFNVQGAAAHSLTLDTVHQAEFFRKRFIMSCMQASSRRATGELPDPAVNIVIVGGGATGVELAAELCHTVRSLAEYNVHSVEASQAVRIRLLESGERLLPHLNSELSQSAAAHLRRLGVQVCTTTTVVGVDADSVHDSSGRRHDSNITVWVAGVEGQNVCTRLGLSLNKAKQILVNNSLQTDLDPHVFAIGDCSSYVCPVRGRAVPPRAQVAHQQALFLARVLGRPGRDTLPHFRYRDYGSLVSIGKFAAVGVLMGAFWRRELLVGGRIARLLYQLLYQKHVLSLHGFSRMAVQMLAHWIRTKVTPPVKLH